MEPSPGSIAFIELHVFDGRIASASLFFYKERNCHRDLVRLRHIIG
jgi:hypothetical protein